MSKGIYVHVPFCAAKCGYCDFLSFDDAEGKWEAYCDALIAEIGEARPVDTVYIGGGTPTVLPSHLLRRLLAALPAAGEVTCEANPGTLDAEKIAVLAEGGVNRVSLGLQAWQPRLLRNIGRRDSGAFTENYKALRDAGFENINIDVMFSLPGQSQKDWEETLREVCALAPEHISAYALTPTDVDDETDRRMYHYCKAFLAAQGYMQYEISNFCKPGFESRHNLLYWKRGDYRGYGLGAHSFVNGVRFQNTEDLDEYLPLSEADAMAEFMFLGLRLTEGVRIAAFAEEFGRSLYEIYGPWIEKMTAGGLLCEKNGYIALTDLGMDLANTVMSGFLE